VYVEGIAQSAFGNVTSQSYGVEGGVRIWQDLRIIVEAGRTRDVATSDLAPKAGQIAAYLSGTQSGSVSHSVREPATFGAVGIRYEFQSGSSPASPYVVGAFGLARVRKDVHFVVAGSDVTDSLAQYGVALGTDLSGSYTKPMFVVGGGVAWTAWQRLVIDFQYRYGRIAAEDQLPSQTPIPAISVNRAGAGIGFRF
jgi:opacity protein-like surface antigen